MKLRYVGSAKKARAMMVWRGYVLRIKTGRTYLENVDIDGWERGPWYLSEDVVHQLAVMAK